jgi:hypothetical protein
VNNQQEVKNSKIANATGARKKEERIKKQILGHSLEWFSYYQSQCVQNVPSGYVHANDTAGEPSH